MRTTQTLETSNPSIGDNNSIRDFPKLETPSTELDIECLGNDIGFPFRVHSPQTGYKWGRFQTREQALSRINALYHYAWHGL
jgi:hypothetical protein